MAKRNLTLKLLVDKANQRVVFAEAGKEVVDFLFSLLALPVGMVTRLLAVKGMVGSVGRIYDSLERLDGTYMQAGFDKNTLLRRSTSFHTSGLGAFLPDCEDPCPPAKNEYYRCHGNHIDLLRGSLIHCDKGGSYVTDDMGVLCPSCRSPMTSQLTYVSNKPETEVTEARDGFVKGVVTYMVMDDLGVQPMSTMAAVTLLNKFQIKDVSSLEQRTVKLPLEEGPLLLKAAFRSETVLSDVFLRRTVP